MERESILISIKKLLGIDEEYTHFDDDIIISINSVLVILTQLGVGPENGFTITGEENTWNEFIGDNKLLEPVKSYVYMRVRLMFDPPTSGVLMDAIKQSIAELEWRLNVTVDDNSKSEVTE